MRKEKARVSYSDKDLFRIRVYLDEDACDLLEKHVSKEQSPSQLLEKLIKEHLT